MLGVTGQEISRKVFELSPASEFSMVFGRGNHMYKFPESGRPIQANADSKIKANVFIKRLPTHGGTTCIAEELVTALQFAHRSAAGRKTIIYVGSGDGYCQGASENAYLQQALKEVRGKNTTGVRINVIGIEPRGSPEKFLRILAAQNGGTFRKLTVEELQRRGGRLR